jgi:hypothetical protein
VEELNIALVEADQMERVCRKFAVALDATIPPLPKDGLVEVDNIVVEDPHYEMKADGNPYMLRVLENNGRVARWDTTFGLGDAIRKYLADDNNILQLEDDWAAPSRKLEAFDIQVHGFLTRYHKANVPVAYVPLPGIVMDCSSLTVAANKDDLNNKPLSFQGIYILLGVDHELWLAQQYDTRNLPNWHTLVPDDYLRACTAEKYEGWVVADLAIHMELLSLEEGVGHAVWAAESYSDKQNRKWKGHLNSARFSDPYTNSLI